MEGAGRTRLQHQHSATSSRNRDLQFGPFPTPGGDSRWGHAVSNRVPQPAALPDGFPPTNPRELLLVLAQLSVPQSKAPPGAPLLPYLRGLRSKGPLLKAELRVRFIQTHTSPFPLFSPSPEWLRRELSPAPAGTGSRAEGERSCSSWGWLENTGRGHQESGLCMFPSLLESINLVKYYTDDSDLGFLFLHAMRFP